MSENTVINPNIQDSSYTVVNPNLQDQSHTVINPSLNASVEGLDPVEQYNIQNGINSVSRQLIREGTTICRKYVVNRQLEVSSGEADLYLCECDNNEYVAKVYKRKFAIKQEVIDKLLVLDSPYVAKIYETG